MKKVPLTWENGTCERTQTTRTGSTFTVKTTRSYPAHHIDTRPVNAVAQAGGVLLTEAAHVTGLSLALGRELAEFAHPSSTHRPSKVLTDLALTLAVGGDSVSDLDTLRAEPTIYGTIASAPTVSRTMSRLAASPEKALAAIAAATASARARAWELAGVHAPNHAATARNPLVIDMDATLVTAHSEKDDAKPTWKKGFGFHPLLAFIDHGPTGTGEYVAGLLRPGNAGSNTASDHIELTQQALTQLPAGKSRPGKSVLIRADTAGGTHAFLEFLTTRRLSYSVGFQLPEHMPELYETLTENSAWEPAYDTAGDGLREGADVAELTSLLDLTGWPEGLRVIVRRERPHPGAQLRFDDVEGYRLTAFATNTRVPGVHLAELEARHRARARCEDRIRIAKDTGLRNFPFKKFAHNHLWLAIVGLASQLEAWKALLAHPEDEVRRWEPKRLRLRVYSVPAVIARSARRVIIHVKDTAACAGVIIAAITRLRGLPAPSG